MKTIFLLFNCVLFTCMVTAQTTTPEVISSGGEFYENTTGSVSYTIGEPVIETTTDGSSTLTQGFQQSHYNITEITETKVDLEVSVYPNPTTDKVNIDGAVSSFELYDINGKILIISTSSSDSNSIDLTNYAAESFLLKVFGEENNQFRTFKIVKNK